MTAKTLGKPGPRTPGPIRTAIIRGLTVVLPPLLTIVIFIWIAGTIDVYVLRPLTTLARDTIVWSIADIRTLDQLPPAERQRQQQLVAADRETAARIETLLDYQRVANGKNRYIPRGVFLYVQEHTQEEPAPRSAKEIYRRYVELRFLQPYQVIPYFLCGFTIVLYLLGKFMAAGAGRFFWGTVERGINRLPLVRTVYSSVKQVSDFIFAPRGQGVQYSRVVAVEWPRRGIWCLAMVTGPSFQGIRDRVGEEVLSVLIPTSPAPMTGFTVTVKKSDTIDLDISIDEALQFIVSCGVVVPPDKMVQLAKPESRELVAAATAPHPASDEG